ncbi:hypothetical protein [Marispirochaeta aestuarii]|nr:hypothetical protein [Marispirochaeta aestuarii]
MKLKPGEVVYIGKEKFTGEIPDEKAKAAGLLKEKKEKKAETVEK